MAVASSIVLSVSACSGEESDNGTVVSITDGDTLVASVNGENQTIRLLNIDSPETKNPNKPVECLGAEATDFLKDLLPVGSTIRLLYDVERTDRYDRTLAAVFTPTDTFVSAEIARAGFGTAVVFGNNTKFLPPVQEAESEAQSSARGIYDPDLVCTLPGQMAAVSESLETVVVTGAGSTAAATGTVITVAASAIATAKTMKTLLQTGKTSTNAVLFSAYNQLQLTTHIGSLTSRIEKAETQLESLKKTEIALAKAESEAAAKKAAAKLKAKQDAAKAQAAAAAKSKAATAAKAQAQAAAAEAERIRNLPPVYVPPAPAPDVPPAYQPPAQDSGGGYPGYTGPRCYLPGGKTYRPC